MENPITHADAGNDTQDMIYLLSYNEASSSVYGFCNNARIQSVSRFVKVSEYAHILGQYAYTADAGEGNCD